MDNFGFIHGELDTKLLILFILRRLPRPVDGDTLTELCFCDTGVSWFEYSQCLADLYVGLGPDGGVNPEVFDAVFVPARIKNFLGVDADGFPDAGRAVHRAGQNPVCHVVSSSEKI